MPGAEPGPRPTQRERDGAAHLLDTALAEGQLDSEEHLERLTQVLEAPQSSQIARALHDLQPAAPRWRERLRTLWVGIPRRERAMVSGVAVLFVGVVGLAVAQRGVDPAAEPSYTAIAKQDQTSVERISAFTDAYEKRFGTTMTGGVQLDEVVAQVQVPVDGAKRRYQTWYLQGDAFNHYGSATSGTPQVDLAAVDHAAAARNLDLAWRGLGVVEPTDIAIIINGPDRYEDQASITYNVRNEFRDAGRLVTDLAGEELSRDPFEPPSSNR